MVRSKKAVHLKEVGPGYAAPAVAPATTPVTTGLGAAEDPCRRQGERDAGDSGRGRSHGGGTADSIRAADCRIGKVARPQSRVADDGASGAPRCPVWSVESPSTAATRQSGDRFDLGRTAPRACRCYKPRQLADVVDAIWDWNLQDANAARRLSIHQAPGTPLLLIAPYRAPVHLEQGGRPVPGKCAVQVIASSLLLRPTGPLGLIVVGLRPEAAERITHAPLGAFGDAEVPLPHLFGRGEAAACDDLLSAACSGSERAAIVEAFLLRRLRPATISLAGRVAARLRRDPNLRVGDLASQFDVSSRHLGRTFQAAFAMSPKHFARLARVERAMLQRQRGLRWAEVASDCGLADQAHLIREFKALVGARPTEFFCRDPGQRTSGSGCRPYLRSEDGRSEFFNSLTPPTDSEVRVARESAGWRIARQ